jgi:hypothetical protein
MSGQLMAKMLMPQTQIIPMIKATRLFDKLKQGIKGFCRHLLKRKKGVLNCAGCLVTGI